jgi:hypothetical protein
VPNVTFILRVESSEVTIMESAWRHLYIKMSLQPAIDLNHYLKANMDLSKSKAGKKPCSGSCQGEPDGDKIDFRFVSFTGLLDHGAGLPCLNLRWPSIYNFEKLGVRSIFFFLSQLFRLNLEHPYHLVEGC